MFPQEVIFYPNDRSRRGQSRMLRCTSAETLLSADWNRSNALIETPGGGRRRRIKRRRRRSSATHSEQAHIFRNYFRTRTKAAFDDIFSRCVWLSPSDRQTDWLSDCQENIKVTNVPQKNNWLIITAKSHSNNFLVESITSFGSTSVFCFFLRTLLFVLRPCCLPLSHSPLGWLVLLLWRWQISTNNFREAPLCLFFAAFSHRGTLAPPTIIVPPTPLSLHIDGAPSLSMRFFFFGFFLSFLFPPMLCSGKKVLFVRLSRREKGVKLGLLWHSIPDLREKKNSQ